jgi:alkylated DNA repair dioxygenase AlkB
MDFTHKQKRQVVPLLLESRGLVVLQDEARHIWLHGIPARKTDHYGDKMIQRGRRVSLTFRKVIVE